MSVTVCFVLLLGKKNFGPSGRFPQGDSLAGPRCGEEGSGLLARGRQCGAVQRPGLPVSAPCLTTIKQAVVQERERERKFEGHFWAGNFAKFWSEVDFSIAHLGRVEAG